MSLNGVEVAAKISGKAAERLAVLLYAVLRDQKKTRGKIRLTNMLKSGKELKVFAVKDGELQKFCEEAKKYGVLYCVLKDNKADDGLTDIMVRAEDASKINRIFERFNLATVDMASVKTEIQKSRDAKTQTGEDIAPPERTQSVDEKLNEFLDTVVAEKENPTSEKAENGNPTMARTKLFFCIGDVSGKGIPASLFMAVTRSVFRTVSAHESMPDRIMDSLNKTMAEMNETNMFVTLFIGVLDLATGYMHYCNAGHDAPMLIGAGVGTLPCDPNIPVGFMPEWKYSLQEAEIYPDTTIFLFTDGLTEAENTAHDLFGSQRVKDVAVDALSKQEQYPRQFITRMTAAVHQFVGNADQSDDLTMMAIQYLNKSTPRHS